MRLNLLTYQRDKSISRSIMRFFSFCTGNEFNCILTGQSIKDPNLISFALMDPYDPEQVCRLIYGTNIPLASVRLLGFDNFCDINIIKVQSLREQIEQSLEKNEADDNRYLPFFKERIKIFFKGHGEQSLLGCIGWVTYYFENYARLLNSDDYSPKGVYKHYLVPGMKYWGEFVRRFEKYAPIIYTAGWDKQTRQIESLIKKVSPESGMDVGLNNMPDFGKDTILAISEIRTILEDIEKQIHSGHG